MPGSLLPESVERELSRIDDRIDYLTDGYGSDATATKILDTREVWVVPTAHSALASSAGVRLTADTSGSVRLYGDPGGCARGPRATQCDRITEVAPEPVLANRDPAP
ncbi:hypothetical protein ABZ946_28540 [Streptomyces sp. NPDC046324]|uniref:hypothetical protein n=1 Tax=Streptomyces sp. NPDC046324 TaxID=3154915 RepID=UPI0033EEA63D